MCWTQIPFSLNEQHSGDMVGKRLVPKKKGKEKKKKLKRTTCHVDLFSLLPVTSISSSSSSSSSSSLFLFYSSPLFPFFLVLSVCLFIVVSHVKSSFISSHPHE